MAQTTYGQTHAVGYPGQIATSNPYDANTYVASEAILPGQFVRVDSSTGKVKVADGADLIAGVAIYKALYPAGGYVAGDVVPVLCKGHVYVRLAASSTVTPGLALHIDTASTDKGAATSAAQDDGNVEVLAGGAFVRSVTSAIAEVVLNIP